VTSTLLYYRSPWTLANFGEDIDDGQGFWLCTKRLSQGRFTWWPTAEGASAPLSARELAIVLWNGNPQQARMADDWKKLR